MCHVMSINFIYVDAQDSLGKTSIVFSTLKPDGRWLHRRDPLLGKSMVAPAEGRT